MDYDLWTRLAVAGDSVGASLATVQTLADVASPRVLGAFALLGLFALVPALYGWYRNRQTGVDPGPGAP